MIRSCIPTLALLALIGMGCATDAPRVAWTKSGAGEAERAAASDECHAVAMSSDLGVDGDRFQAQARANLFNECMREKGWEQVLVEPAD